jgi:hypothetical protein
MTNKQKANTKINASTSCALVFVFYMAYQVPARLVCWYIVQPENKKLKDCRALGVDPGH